MLMQFDENCNDFIMRQICYLIHVYCKIITVLFRRPCCITCDYVWFLPCRGSETVTWSSCSMEQFADAFHQGFDYCLRNLPDELYGDAYCGNGFVEKGEECDCGLAKVGGLSWWPSFIHVFIHLYIEPVSHPPIL